MTALLRNPRRVWIVLVAMVLMTRLPALVHPRAIDDEQAYAVAGRELAQGGVLYLDVVDRKPPLLFAVYRSILGTTGLRNWPALHVAAVLWTLTTMAGLYFILRPRFDWQTGAMAAALYGLFQMWGDYRMLALNGELMMNLPIVLAVLIAFRPGSRTWRPELFVAGALVAVATLLKQPAGVAGVALAWYVLSPAYARSRRLGVGPRVWHASLLAAGFALTLGIAALTLARQGILRETLYWSVLNHADAVGPTTWHYWSRALPSTSLFLAETVPVWLAAAAVMWSTRAAEFWKEHAAERHALSVLLGVSLLAVSINGQFLYHYYLQLLPPLCLLAAPVLRDVLTSNPRMAAAHSFRRGLLAWLVCTLLLFATVDTIGLAVNRRDTEAGAWVRAHSGPDDRLFVWGQAGRFYGMYLDADRRPASRFIASFPLTGHIFGSYPAEWGTAYEDQHVVPGAWDTLQQDFSKHPPRYIIDAEAALPRTRYPVSRYPVFSALLQREYRPVATTADGVIYERQLQ